MSTTPIPSDPPSNAAARAILGELAEIGLEIARALGREAAGETPGAGGDLGLAYSRASRAVRMTVLLQGQVLKDIEALDQGARDGETARGAAAANDPHAAKREQVRQIVGRVILDQHREIDDVERLSRKCRDLVECEAMETLLSKPASELVSIICWNLDLWPEWSDLICEAWAQAEIDSGDPGQPLRDWLNQRRAQGLAPYPEPPDPGAPDPARPGPSVAGVGTVSSP